MMGHADGHQQSFAQTRFKTLTPFKIRPQTWALRVTLDTVGGGPIVLTLTLTLQATQPCCDGRSENRGSSRKGGPSGGSEHC